MTCIFVIAYGAIMAFPLLDSSKAYGFITLRF